MNQLIFREATANDIDGMQVVRRSVIENALSSPDRIRNDDYLPYLGTRGRGWVAVSGETITGFAMIDIEDNSVWALFVLPEYEGQGIGKTLQRIMMDWYFQQSDKTVWLSTAFNTRAEEFYRRQGWRDAGLYSAIERKFELSKADWEPRSAG